MKVTILGCGTSTGVPVPGCRCAVCRSQSPKNKRPRASLHLESSLGSSIIIDTSPDFRQQVLLHGVSRVDGVLYTHAHADHILGLDDLRSFNFIQRSAIPCYATGLTWASLERTFHYVFSPEPDYRGGGLPQIGRNEIPSAGHFSVADFNVETLELYHGKLLVTGFRFGKFAYATDCNHIPDHTFERLRGLDVLILDALREEPHPTHFTISESIEMAKRIGAKKTIFNHFTHTVDYDEWSAKLPAGITLAYDGMQFEVDEW